MLVAADHTVKVADFGLARECLHTDAMTRVGSVQWAAPEVLLGQGYSHKCDLWSFGARRPCMHPATPHIHRARWPVAGVVCWELLTSKVPFYGMSPVIVASKVALEGMRLPVPPNSPRILLRLMARCWSEAPVRRPNFSECLEILSKEGCSERSSEIPLEGASRMQDTGPDS